MNCADVIILLTAFRYIAALQKCPERLQVPVHQRNRKKLKAFCNILPWHLRKTGIHPQKETNRSMGARDKREGAARAKQQKAGRARMCINDKLIVTSLHTNLKSQMRK